MTIYLNDRRTHYAYRGMVVGGDGYCGVVPDVASHDWDDVDCPACWRRRVEHVEDSLSRVLETHVCDAERFLEAKRERSHAFSILGGVL